MRSGVPIEGVLERVSAREREVRVELAAAFRAVALRGWDDWVFTHLSVRVPETDEFLINPYQLGFDEICASNLVRIRADGTPTMDTPYSVNRAGWVIHGAIHEGRQDARAVFHLHTTAGQAVSASEAGLLPITQTAMFVSQDLAYHDYEGVAYELDERTRIVADIGEKHHLMLRSHGTLTVGAQVRDAYLRMYFLERACQAQVAASSLGALVQPAASAIERSAAAARAGLEPIGRGIAWPALVRKLDRIDPSYKE